MKAPNFGRVQAHTKPQWRRKASEAVETLTISQIHEVRARFGYPLRVKDFNIRMCKKLLKIIDEVRNETDRTADDS